MGDLIARIVSGCDDYSGARFEWISASIETRSLRKNLNRRKRR
jgi:hypothetical protein